MLHSSVQLLSHVRHFATPWTTACQASLSITNSRSPPKPISIELVKPAIVSSSVVPFSSCLQSFPASRSFQMSQFFTLGGQSIGASASISVLWLVITFLPRSKRLLISWLQSPSAVILEPRKIKSDTVSPIYLPWSDGTRCHDLSFLNVEL